MQMSSGKITEGTLIPLSVAGVVLSMIIGLAIDYTNTKADVRALKKDVTQLEELSDNVISIMVKLGLQPKRHHRDN